MTTYFDVNDGDELMEEAQIKQDDEPLSWRQDAAITHSDWTIQVETEDNGPSQTYHVHKNILSVGLRSCEYFSTLFSTPAALSERQEQRSCIKLHVDDAKAFPIMLDFVYSPSGQLAATTENAISLRSLARYFRCRQLMNKVNHFIQDELHSTTAVKYLKAAAERKDEKVEESARKLIVAEYDDVSTEDLLSLPIGLFQSIGCSTGGSSASQERVIDTVRLFFEANPKDLTAQLLNDMTVDASASTIRVDTAKGLLSLIGQLDREEDEDSWLALDNLCKLCAESLSSEWKQMDTEDLVNEFESPAINGDYRGSGRLVVFRLAHALRRAKEDHAKQVQAKITLQNQLSKVKNQLVEAKNQLAEVKRNNLYNFQKQERVYAD